MRSALPALVYVFLTLLAIPVLLVCVLYGLRDVFLAYGRWMMRVGARVLVVLPYVPDAVKAWVDVLPGQLDKVKEQKHPADPAKLDDKGKQTMERYRGPAGIRLSVQGPRGLERDEVNARAAGGAFQSVDVRAARLHLSFHKPSSIIDTARLIRHEMPQLSF
jgi:hypothetical protein